MNILGSERGREGTKYRVAIREETVFKSKLIWFKEQSGGSLIMECWT